MMYLVVFVDYKDGRKIKVAIKELIRKLPS
jgi:hypothetical protein